MIYIISRPNLYANSERRDRQHRCVSISTMFQFWRTTCLPCCPSPYCCPSSPSERVVHSRIRFMRDILERNDDDWRLEDDSSHLLPPLFSAPPAGAGCDGCLGRFRAVADLRESFFCSQAISFKIYQIQQKVQ